MAGAGLGEKKGREGCRMALFVGGLVVVAGLLVVGAIVGFGLLFHFTAKDYEISDEQRAAIHTVADVVEQVGGEIEEDLEVWTASRMFDGSVMISYEYEVPDWADLELADVYVSVELNRERSVGDAVAVFIATWQAFRAAYGMAGGGLSVEEQSGLLEWGDATKFGYLSDGEDRYGMIFCGRLGKTVYFMVCTGLVLEDREALESFYRGKLDLIGALEW
jgi:hypothetical protein